MCVGWNVRPMLDSVMEGGRVTRYLGDAVDGGGGGGRLFIAMFDDGCVGNEFNEFGCLLFG